MVLNGFGRLHKFTRRKRRVRAFFAFRDKVYSGGGAAGGGAAGGGAADLCLPRH